MLDCKQRLLCCFEWVAAVQPQPDAAKLAAQVTVALIAFERKCFRWRQHIMHYTLQMAVAPTMEERRGSHNARLQIILLIHSLNRSKTHSRASGGTHTKIATHNHPIPPKSKT